MRLTHSFIIILVSFTFLSEVFRLLIAPSGQVDPEARGLREYISNSHTHKTTMPSANPHTMAAVNNLPLASSSSLLSITTDARHAMTYDLVHPLPLIG